MRGAKLKTGRDILERAVQHLYPLELHCAQMPVRSRLNPATPEFHARPQRDAAAVAAVRIQEIAEYLNFEH